MKLPVSVPTVFRPFALSLALAAASQALIAQETPKLAPHSASCKPDRAEPNDADIAFARGDYKKATGLYAAAITKDPADSISHHLQIASLIADGKLSDAIKNTEAWTTAEPKNPYAILSAGEIRFNEGDWPESYALALKAMTIDACLPIGYEDLATFESLAGYRATARKHLALAHALAPNNQEIRGQWIRSLNHAEYVQQEKDYLANSPAIEEKKRQADIDEFNRKVALGDDNCALSSSKGPAVIPMSPVRNDILGVNSWGIGISFNGKRRVLQIDTGASGFTLTQSEGSELGLTKIDTAKVGGIGSGGSTWVTVNRAETVKIGGLTFKNCKVDVLQQTSILGDSISTFGGRIDSIDGLVGTDIFSRYLVTLDYVKREIRLDPLPTNPEEAPAAALDTLGGDSSPDAMSVDRYIAPEMKNWTKIYLNGHMLIVPARLSNKNVPGRTRLFIMDTGAENNLIDVAAANEITTADENKFEGLGGLSGAVNKVFDVGKFTLDFAGLRLPAKGFDATDLSAWRGVSGFIGYPTLKQLVIHIDYRDNLVLFEAPNGRPAEPPGKKK